MDLINIRLLSHPMNWITILLMLIIAGIFGHLLLTLLEQEPATAGGKKKSVPANLSTNQVASADISSPFDINP
jgi:hypothetical protein